VRVIILLTLIKEYQLKTLKLNCKMLFLSRSQISRMSNPSVLDSIIFCDL
jgi:hypothetical protein